VVLRSVDLRVEPGEIVGVMGRNGAGKTTLLSIVAGLVQPTGGERRYANETAHEVGIDLRARMAVVAHTPQAYPRLSARENLDLFAGMARAAGVPVLATGIVLERMGLADVGDQRVGTFSRGMMQQLALARALALRAELLLLDEPLTALDSTAQARFLALLREERARGAAVLLCSHDVDVMAAVADRTALLASGEIAGECLREADDAGRTYRARLLGLVGATEDGRA
jgi:ABC-type multidrug transport system ATPase subunit